jgi:maltooligosyltrehalose trehalohydrolase
MGFTSADPPDPQSDEAFTRSILDWSERERAHHAEMLAWTRALVALRRSHPVFTSGARPIVTVNEPAFVLAMERGPFTVVVNLGAGQRVPLRRPGVALELASAREVSLSGAELTMPRDGLAIVRHAATSEAAL